MKYNILTILIVHLLLNSCFGQNKDDLNYIKDNAVVLVPNVNNDDFKDLSYLKNVFKDRRIIGMGEATHGTQEFQFIKFRVFKYLVKQMGFKLLGIEDNFSGCRRINDYVLYGKGDAKKAIAGMDSWPWKTKEVLQMVEWMRSYNADKTYEQKVKFYGFDIQTDKNAIGLITEKLKRLDSGYYNSHFSLLRDLDTYNKDGYRSFSKGRRDSAKTLLTELKSYVNDQESKLLKLFSKDEVAYTKHDIRLVEQCLDEDEASQTRKSFINASSVRDRDMAENIQWILDYEGKESKMMLWAHNGHIAKTIPLYESMGAHLSHTYTDQYYAVGFDFNKGSFRAYGRTKTTSVFTLPGAIESSSGHILARLNIPEFFVDIEKAVKNGSPARDFFTREINQIGIASAFDSQQKATAYYLKAALYNEYDGLIFVNETSPTEPIN